MSSADEISENGRPLGEPIPTLPVAFSLGGRHGNVVAPLGGGLSLGGLVIIDNGESSPVVGQIESLDLAERPLTDVAGGADVGRPHRTTSRFVTGSIALLGRLDDTGLDTTAPINGFGEGPFRTATDDETHQVVTAMSEGRHTFGVGTVVGRPDVAVSLRSQGFARHTFLCGQSGSGKTYTTGVILERLRLATSLPMIILDPNSDHVHLAELRDDAAADPAADAYRALADRVVVARARGHGGDQTLAIHFSDLTTEGQALLLQLDPVADLDAFGALRRAVESLPLPHSLHDVMEAAISSGSEEGRRLALRIENLAVADWDLWCRSGESSLVENRPFGDQCFVLDLGSFGEAAERQLVAAATLRRLWMRREEKHPVLVVVDEAHNIFPAHPESALETSATGLGIAIAAEGRKYGLHLLVATQRPSKVHANVVSQCDNLVLLRMNSVADVDDLCGIFSHVPPGLISEAPDYRLGEVLFAGPIAALPTRSAVRSRLSPEGGGDIPTDWAAPQGDQRT